MDVAALIVAIVALLFAVSAAGFGVYIQFQTYKATTDHLRGVEGSVSGFRTDMQGLIGELKGMTNTLVDAQQQQFNRMLDAFVTRPGAAVEVAEKTGESADKLQQISGEMDALKEELRHAASADEVQHKLDELAGRLEAVSASTARAARLAEDAARDVGRPPVETGPLASFRVVPDTVTRGQSVDIRLLKFYRSLGELDRVSCDVGSPTGHGWTSMVTLSELLSRLTLGFVFPDDFPGGSTDETGEYDVDVFVGTMRRGARYHLKFRVVEPRANVVE